MARIKHIVTNPYHLWAHEAQDWAKNSSGNQSFNGTSAKSYAATIAEIVRNNKGKRAFMVSTRSWSVTTAGHQSSMRRAIPSGETVFNVPRLGTHSSDHLENVRAYWATIAENLGKAKRARKNAEWYQIMAAELATELRAYIKFFGLKGKEFRPPSDSLAEDALKQSQTFAKEDARREAQALKELQEREALRRADAAEKIAAWQKGERVYLPILSVAFLRVSPSDPETVETTHGATVPLDHVKRAIPGVLAAVRAGRDWTPKNDIRLGHYTVRGVTAEGTLTVGCHRFERAEVERFAAEVLAA